MNKIKQLIYNNTLVCREIKIFQIVDDDGYLIIVSTWRHDPRSENVLYLPKRSALRDYVSDERIVSRDPDLTPIHVYIIGKFQYLNKLGDVRTVYQVTMNGQEAIDYYTRKVNDAEDIDDTTN